MMRTLLFLLTFLFVLWGMVPNTLLARGKSCLFYPVHPLSVGRDLEHLNQTETIERCRARYLKIDTDHDGIPDWTDQLDQRPSSFLIANDPDIDGDGWDNIQDPDPTNSKIKGQNGMFPKHLLLGPAGGKLNSKNSVNEGQLNLWQKTALISVNLENWHSPELLNALVMIYQSGLSSDISKKLSMLRYVIADNSIIKKGALAYYSHDLKALIVGNNKVYQNHPENIDLLTSLTSILSHEIGHALVFSLLSPKQLASIGASFGSWNLGHGHQLRDLFSPILFERHSLFAAPAGAIEKMLNIPSRYSMQNIHEWFAECFSYVMTKSLIDKGLLTGAWPPTPNSRSPLTPAFETWLRKKFLL